MRVLVTGGAGYIGSFCIRALLASGYSVVSIDRRAQPTAARFGIEAIRGDIADQSLVETVLRTNRVDAVVHLAAEKSVGDAMVSPGPHLANNVGGSIALLEAMQRAGVRRIVFSSSAAVYGSPAVLPVNEDAPLQPENPYGAGKVMVEETLRWFGAAHGLDGVVLRYFNAAGAARDGSLGEEIRGARNLVPRVMDAILGSGAPVDVFGADYPTADGTAERDYVHVEDVAAAHLRALEWSAAHPGIHVFNIGTGRRASVLEVLHVAERASGRPAPRTIVARRPGDPASIWADTERAAAVLGWRAAYTLDDILETAWTWALASAHPGPGARPDTSP